MPIPTTISPLRLRGNRPPFRTHHTFPLNQSEYIDSTDPLPLDWVQDFAGSSPASAPDEITARPADHLLSGFPLDPQLQLFHADTMVVEEQDPNESMNHVESALDGILPPPFRDSTPSPTRRRIRRLPSGHSDSTTTSDSSVDTPLSEKRKKNHQAFLARTKQYQSTPTPHHPLSEARMLAPCPTPIKRAFHLGDDEVDEEEETINMGLTGVYGNEENVEDEEGEVTVVLHVKERHGMHGGQRKQVGETPAHSSEYKATGSSELEQSDDEYNPQRSARTKRKTHRKQSRARPYTRKTRVKDEPALPPATPLVRPPRSTPLRPITASQSSPLAGMYEEDVTGLKGDERIRAKVREFRRYLVAPKRLREPRFDMKVFHWAMTGCPELKWQSNGQGVVIQDIGKFYKNVLHKEVKERKKQKGQEVHKRDLPGKSSFERQLSGYGFTRSTEGKTMYINRPDLRRDDKKLLNEIKRVWDMMALAVAVKVPKSKSEPTQGAAFLRKQNVDLEVILAEREHELGIYQEILKTLLRGDQPPIDHLKWACAQLGVKRPALSVGVELKSSPKAYDHLPLSSVRDDPVDSALEHTPIKSIDKFPPQSLRRSTRAKRERA